MKKLFFFSTYLVAVFLVIIVNKPINAKSEVYDLAIIPMPKRVSKLSGSISASKNFAYLIENKLNKKHKIGIEEINTKLRSIGGFKFPIKTKKNINESDYNLIIVGNLQSPWIQEICRLSNIKYNEPGEQGYIIKFFNRGDKNAILIGGGSDQGTLYGCITFCYLIEKNDDSIYFKKFDIWDRPDFKYRMADSIIACRSRAKETIDFALHHKNNLIWAGFAYDHNIIVSNKKWVKDINNYAWERGIRIMYNSWWNIGEAPIPDGANRYYYPYSGMIGHRGMLFCWSNDELLAQKAEELYNFIKDTNAKAIYLHCIDGGGIKDPELWSKRCNKCRKRFGADRALADAHVINTFYKYIKKVSEDVIFVTVIYPYIAGYTKPEYKNILIWLKEITNLIPEDVFICVREASVDDFFRWCQIVRQPIFVYHASEPRDWEIQRPYITSFRFAKTFYSNETKENIYWNTAYRVLSKIQVMGTAEYTWNIHAPGSEYLQDLNNPPLWKKVIDNPKEIDTWFLPRACRILFENASNDMMKIISYNLSPYLMVNPQSWLTKEYCHKQIKRANQSLEILRKAEDVIPAGSRDFYEAHIANSLACQYFAKARINIYNIGKKIKVDEIEGAKKELQETLDLINESEQSFYELKKKNNPIWNGGVDFKKCKNQLMSELNKLSNILAGTEN